MATRIIEFGGDDRPDELPLIPYQQYITAQTPITATATSAQSSAFNAATSLVVIDSDEAVHVHVASNPTATTSHMVCPAGGRLDLSVKAGDKVAVRTP